MRKRRWGETRRYNLGGQKQDSRLSRQQLIYDVVAVQLHCYSIADD